MIRVGSMKRQFVIPSLGIVVISASAACFAQQVNAMVSRAFENACHNGADARVEFHVVDDVGKPVPLAKVNVFFDMMGSFQGTSNRGEYGYKRCFCSRGQNRWCFGDRSVT